MESWTFSALVGAFLDLALAYLLLCGSTLVFFASKALSLFGLHLACSCPNCPSSLHRLLVDCPVRKISDVQLSLKSKPPFDSLWIEDCRGRHLNVKLLEDGDRNHAVNGLIEFDGEAEGEASCSSLSINSPVMRRSERLRFGAMRRRRRAAVGDCSRGMEREMAEDDGSVVASSEADCNRYEKEVPASFKFCERAQNGFHLNEVLGEGEDMDKELDSDEELVGEGEIRQMSDGNDENAIRALEQALEEEQAARAALYVELEKERSAAATAADEAMAMILRLQKEKASIEMEARQYQRMIEEKSAYDAEEMDILKEILVRREREKHFLEKEVEVYRRMMLPENEQLDDGTMGQMLHSSFDPSEDPVLMLQQISESIDKREMAKAVKESSNIDSFSVKKQDHALTCEKESSSSDRGEGHDCSNLGDVSRNVSIEKHHLQKLEAMDECYQESQEKGMVSTDGNPSAPQAQGMGSEAQSGFCNSNDRHGNELLEKNIIFVDEEPGKNYNSRPCLKADKSRGDTELNFPIDGIDLEKHRKDADPTVKDWHNSVSEAEPSVLDVHVIDDKSKLSDEGAGKEREALSIVMAPDRLGKCGVQSEAFGVRGVDILCDHPSTSRGETKLDAYRSSSDTSSTVDKALGKSLLFELRRNSMSAVENERLKLENEVSWLRERLRIVQQGREKLSFSMEHREREKVQLQLLEDIARQLNEIRQLTEPGKAVRQASLPPPSSKVSSKKRRYRSVSSGFHGSS